MKQLFRKIRKSHYSYQNLIEINIFKSSLLKNIEYFSKLTGLKIAPVLKSNAYGHGLIGTAKAIDHLQLPFFVVDSYYEALILKNENIKNTILIAGFTHIENITKSNLKNIIYTISSVDQVEKLEKLQKRKVLVALKFNTGMNRQGIKVSDAAYVLKKLIKHKNIIIHSIYSHLADPENENFLNSQLEQWRKLYEIVEYQQKPRPLFHLAATSSSYHTNKFKSDILRLGIGLFGLHPILKDQENLTPSLEMFSLLTEVKNVKKGEYIGYNGTYITQEDIKVGIVPAGYYEGIDLRLSNKGFLYYQDKPCQILGRISMNMSVINLSNINAKIGDKIEIISKDMQKLNSFYQIAKNFKIIPYELMVKIPSSIKRNYI